MDQIDIPRPEDVDDRVLAGLIAEAVLQRPVNPDLPFQASEFFAHLERLAVNQSDARPLIQALQTDSDWTTKVQRICWRWVALGILVPVVSFGQFELTPEGREVLAEQAEHERPLLVRGGITAILEDAETPPPEAVVFHVGQSQRCLEAGLYQAAVVMLGIATEGLVTALADELTARATLLQLRPAPKRSSALARVEWLQKAFEEKASLIRAEFQSAGAPVRWVGELPLMLSGANAIRMTRNLAGHPTSYRATLGETWFLLVAFPRLSQAMTETTTSVGHLAVDG